RGVEERHRPGREGGDERVDAEVRVGLLPADTRRTEVQEQLEGDRAASSDRDVSLQKPDARVAAGNRTQHWWKAPFDRHPLHHESSFPQHLLFCIILYLF